MSNFFTVSATELKSALVYAVLTAVLSMLVYVVGIGDIFAISLKPVVNIGAISLGVGLISIIKNLLTTKEGMFVGAVKVK